MNFAGIDVGGTKLLARLENPRGDLLASLRLATGRACGPTMLLDRIDEIAAAWQRDFGPITGLGVGFPGLVDRRHGLVLSSVILDGWDRVPFADDLGRRLGLPCAIDNDVKNAARAEIEMRGPDGSADDLLFISIGTGIGGALARGGRIVAGAGGLAGEIGHVAVVADGAPCRCGRRGCVGPLAAGEGLAAQLGLSTAEFEQAVRAGRPEAMEALDRSAHLVGKALGSALNLLNPGWVVLGGGMLEASPRYFAAIEAAARTECFGEISASCRFAPARAGYDAGARGSVLLAREALGGLAL